MTRRGYTLIELLVVIAIIGVLVGLLLAAVQKVRAAAARTDCQNRLRQLGIALHHHHDARHKLPPGVTYSPSGDPAWFISGWQVHILPYVEQSALYAQAVEDFKATPFPGGPPPTAGWRRSCRRSSARPTPVSAILSIPRAIT